MLKVFGAFVDSRSLFKHVTACLYQSCGVLTYPGAIANNENSFRPWIRVFDQF